MGIEPPKPRRWIADTPFGGIRRDGLVRDENSSGPKSDLFLQGKEKC